MKGATPVLLKVLLFQLSGHGNPHDDAMPNFISDSSSCISGLSLGMSDWRNWLGRTSPVREVVSSNPGRDTCLVWNSGKFCNPSFLGG